VAALYLDSSAVLRAVLETGLTPEIDASIHDAQVLLTSRLSIVESARAFHRLRRDGQIAERRLVDAERAVGEIWARCELWELSPAVCELACRVAPRLLVRALEALHLATFLLARRRLGDVELLTADDRLKNAANPAI
jgi:predicted nucleic acid-binding protein